MHFGFVLQVHQQLEHHFRFDNENNEKSPFQTSWVNHDVWPLDCFGGHPRGDGKELPAAKTSGHHFAGGRAFSCTKISPHLTIQTAKGELKELNFPLVMSSPFDKKSGQLTFATDVENRFRHMSAAKVRVYVDNIQSIHPRVYPRIWEIQSESFSLSYEHLLLNYNKLEPGVLRGFEWIMGVVSVALGVLIDYLRQRNHRRLAMEKRLATTK